VIVLGWGAATAMVALVAIAGVASVAGRIEPGRAVIVAAGRALLQLAAVSVIIAAVVRSLPLTVAFVLLMFLVATATSARRITGDRGGLFAGLAIAAGALPVLAIVLVSGAVPPRGIAIVPIAGIVIGGAMSAASTAGRRALDELRTRWGEYEAGLSLGLAERDAALEICRPSAAQALTPALDQTRTVGLVSLPGAFVGVLLASGDPVQAGVAQLLVLVGLLAAEVIAVLVTVELVARKHIPHRIP
jgi:putative ABC transport system permease protein